MGLTLDTLDLQHCCFSIPVHFEVLGFTRGTLLPSRRNLSWSCICPPPWTGFRTHSFCGKSDGGPSDSLLWRRVLSNPEQSEVRPWSLCSCMDELPTALWSFALPFCLSFFLLSVFSCPFFLSEDFTPVKYKAPPSPTPSREVPPYNGFGSEEDSLSFCQGLLPKPPQKDFHKFMEKDRLAESWSQPYYTEMGVFLWKLSTVVCVHVLLDVAWRVMYWPSLPRWWPVIQLTETGHS